MAVKQSRSMSVPNMTHIGHGNLGGLYNRPRITRSRSRTASIWG